MPRLPQKTVMRRLREVGMLEWMCYLRSEHPLQDYTVQNSSGNTLFIKAMWTVPVRAPASLRSERVRGRKARGPQTEETGCKCQTLFLSLWSSRRKQTTSVRFFSPSLYKIKNVSFKILYCHDDTWFHLNLTFLKPWSNQCIFLMEMFSSYVNETMYFLGNLSFFKIHVNRFMAWDDSLCANVISKCMLWVRGLVSLSEFWNVSYL